MGTFNTGIRSTTIVHDTSSSSSLAANKGASHTTVNYSGTGWLTYVGQYNADSAANCSVGINTDGGGEVAVEGGPTASYLLAGMTRQYNSSNDVQIISIAMHLEFRTSLVVKGYNNDATTAYRVNTNCLYAHLSEEIKRETIPANDPIPNPRGGYRDETYPETIMLITYSHNGNPANPTSNRVVQPREDQLDIATGKLKTYNFNTTLNAPLTTVADSTFTGTKTEWLEGKPHMITITNGVIDMTTVPTIVPVEAVWDFFTGAEIDAMYTSTANICKRVLDELRIRQRINKNSNAFKQATTALVNEGVLTAERRSQLLSI